MKSLNVEEETHKRVMRVVGCLAYKEGKAKTQDDAVVFLLDFWEKSQPKKEA